MYSKNLQSKVRKIVILCGAQLIHLPDFILQIIYTHLFCRLFISVIRYIRYPFIYFLDNDFDFF